MERSMKTASNILGTIKWTSGGADGGGYVTAIQYALDGTAVSRNDCALAHIRKPGATIWTELFRIGDNISEADYAYQLGERCYEIAVAEQDSNLIYAAWHGRLWKSTDGGSTWAKTGFKGGAIDTTLMYGIFETRLGGQHLRIDPLDKTTVLFAHPYDGVYRSTDAGATWALIPGLPIPTDSVGANVAFDRTSGAGAGGRCSRLAICIRGRGTYVSTTTATGTYTLSSGGPTTSTSMDWSNGKLFVTGDGVGNAAAIHVLASGTWADVGGGRIASCVAVHLTNQNKIAALSVGGANHISADGGATWSTTDNFDNVFRCDDIPWMSFTPHGYLALGGMAWDPLQADRLVITNGIGVFYLDGPPATGSTKWISMTLGIKQILGESLVVTPTGDLMLSVQDRGIMTFTRENAKRQTFKHGPDVDKSIQHGNGTDYAADNPNHWVVVRTENSNENFPPYIHQTYDAGKSWNAVPGAPSSMRAGNVAMGVDGNILWASSNISGNTGLFRGTDDNGATWFTPNFAGISLTGAQFHYAYTFRRSILFNDKANPSTFYVYCFGNRAHDATDLYGVWKSTDKGRNFALLKSGYIESEGQDFYHGKLRGVPGKAGHMVWVRGPSDAHPTPPASGGFYMTTDDWATKTLMAGWAGPEDIAFGPNPLGGYPAIYVLGWRGGQHGIWGCFDFNAATKAGTWQRLTGFPMGHADENSLIAADPVAFGRLYFAPSSGGLLVGDLVDEVQGT
jgi:hypothetical protein